MRNMSIPPQLSEDPESRVRAGLKGSPMRAGDLCVEHPSASYVDFQEKATAKE